MAVAEFDKRPLYERFGIPDNMRANLTEMTWESLASGMANVAVRCEAKREKSRKLAKKIELTKIMLAQRVRDKAREGRLDTKFLIDLVHLLDECEQMATENEIDMSEFLIFIYALIEKMKKEKVKVYETAVRFPEEKPLDELARLKGSSEAHMSVRRKKGARKASEKK